MSAGKHVLVADDQADNRGLVVQLLRRLGHRISEASDGQEALAVIARDRPDLVLLDLMMPVLDGFGVLEALREDAGPLMPVVVVTATTEREERLRALALGAHELLNKPIDREELNIRVHSLLNLKQSHDELRKIQEALAAANAELTAANEELQAQQEELEDLNSSLQDVNRRVEAEVAARTAELQSANQALTEADRYKDEFLSVISHELRTPLNFITGFASTLEDGVQGPLNPRQNDAVGKILSGADRMLELVDNLLDLARIQSGRLSVSPHPTDFMHVMEDVLAHMRPLAQQAHVEFDVAITAPEAIAIDGPRIAQVLTNLLSNAIKFSPHGTTIVLRSYMRDDALVTEVADQGCGIAPADLPRLFQRFGQLDMSSTRRAGGSGLGLAICKALVEAHGGEIGARSQGLGKGSVFWFALPCRLSEHHGRAASIGAADG